VWEILQGKLGMINFWGYSLDLKGSEYYTVYIRDINSKNLITEKIEDTDGGITFSLDDKFIFYSKLDKYHRPKKIYRHEIGTSIKKDFLIFEEKKSEAFTVSIGLSSDEKYYFITSSDHNTSEQYYFLANEKNPKPKLIKQRKKGVIYSVNSWDNFFYIHTNENAEDFKIERCEDLSNQSWEKYIAAKDEVLIGGLVFLKDWIIRSETSDALSKIFVRNYKTNVEEEIKFADEKVIVPGISKTQKDDDTNNIFLSYSSPKTQSRTFLYDLKSKEKKLVKEQEIPSGHKPEDYIVERLECRSP
jgi:Protease II